MSAELIVVSPQQERLWRLEKATPGAACAVSARLIVTGASASAVRTAIHAIVADHPVLRLRLRRHPAFNEPLPYEIGVQPAAAAFVVTAAEEGSNETVVSFELPAYCLDDLSLHLIAAELAELLDGRAATESAAPFGLVAQWMREMEHAEETAMARAMWRERIAELRLAVAQGGPMAATSAGFTPRRIMRRLAAPVVAMLQAFDDGATESEQGAGLLAAWSVVSRRRLGWNPLPIGVRLDGRNDPDLRGVIGPLAQIAPVRLPEELDRPLHAIVADARMALFEASARQTGFSWPADVVGEAGRPLFAPVSFAVARPIPPAIAGTIKVTVRQAVSIDEHWLYRLVADGQDIILEYDSGQVSEVAAERMLQGLSAFLTAVHTEPASLCTDLPVLGTAERAFCTARLKGQPTPRCEAPAHAFRRQAQDAPDRIAVQAADGDAVSYRGLHTWSNALAWELAAHGAAPERLVASCLSPSAELAAMLIATMKTGAAFVPLEPTHPPRRNAELLARLAPVALVVDGAVEPEIAEVCHRRAIALVSARRHSAGGASPDFDPPPANDALLAYALFTSGSTGAPRCVGVPQAALANQIDWFVRRFALRPGDRVMARTSPAFDAAIWELLAPLAVGATVTPAAPAARHDPGALADAVRVGRPTRLQLVPNLLNRLIDLAPEMFAGLETLFSGGEVLTAPLARRLVALLPQLVNLYGPTECCIQIAAWNGDPARYDGVVPVGSAIPGAGLATVEHAGGFTAIGAIGHLVVGGVCLARGYLGDPAATASAFVADGLGESRGARLYLTGDVGAIDEAGEAVILGRRDAQVKIRGARVEPAEAAAILRSVPGVADCTVVAMPSEAGGAALVAIVVAEPGRESELQQRLPEEARQRLPDFMVPARFVPVTELPRLASGKLDQERLRRLAGRRPFTPPETATERLIANVWSEVLKVGRVGRYDGFFELGGHSILMLRVAARLRAALGREVPLRLIHDAPDVAELAQHLDAALPVGEGATAHA